MEWCHQIPFIDALMIYWRRPYVIVGIVQNRDFIFMSLAILTHIPLDVSAITKGFHLVKYGESWKKVFSSFNVFGIALCYEMQTGLSCTCFLVS